MDGCLLHHSFALDPIDVEELRAHGVANPRPLLGDGAQLAFDVAAELYEDRLFDALSWLRRSRSQRLADYDDFEFDQLHIPEGLRSEYDFNVMRKMMWCFGEVIRKLKAGRPRWSCVAEELMANAIIHTCADFVREIIETPDDVWGAILLDYATNADESEPRRIIGTLKDRLFEDCDFDALFDPESPIIYGPKRHEVAALTGMSSLLFVDWFTPFNPDRAVHPLASGLNV